MTDKTIKPRYAVSVPMGSATVIFCDVGKKVIINCKRGSDIYHARLEEQLMEDGFNLGVTGEIVVSDKIIASDQWIAKSGLRELVLQAASHPIASAYRPQVLPAYTQFVEQQARLQESEREGALQMANHPNEYSCHPQPVYMQFVKRQSILQETK